MDIKARGNALFRDGDFRSAANEFRRALETADQVKHRRLVWIFFTPFLGDTKIPRVETHTCVSVRLQTSGNIMMKSG